MKKLLFASIVILFSDSAFSDFNWKLMGETKNADKYYIDLSSIEKDNNKYNDKEKIVLNFEDGIISSVLYHINSLKVDISKIQLDIIPNVDDSLFYLNDSSVMIIDLRE